MVTIIGIGFFAGILIGAIGIGGVIVVPALTYLSGTDIRRAIPAALAGFVLSGFIGTLQYAKKGTINWSAARVLVGAALPAAMVGALAAREINVMTLKFLVGLITLSAGLLPVRESLSAKPLPVWGLAAIGVVTGFASALTGTSGPLLLLPMLLWWKEPILAAIALSQVIQLPISLTATATNLAAGAVDFEVGATLAVALAAGCWFGSSAAHAVPTKLLRRVVSYLLVVIGIAMIVDASLQILR